MCTMCGEREKWDIFSLVLNIYIYFTEGGEKKDLLYGTKNNLHRGGGGSLMYCIRHLEGKRGGVFALYSRMYNTQREGKEGASPLLPCN